MKGIIFTYYIMIINWNFGLVLQKKLKWLLITIYTQGFYVFGDIGSIYDLFHI